MTALADHAFHRNETTTTFATESRSLYTSLDFAGLIAAVIMALGPLTAYAVGF